MASSEKRTVAFFDFVTHYGGAQHSTVAACEVLQAYYDVHVIDAYGVCEKYVEALRAAGLRLHVLQPDVGAPFIGFRKNPGMRLLKALGQLPAFWRLRRALEQTIRRIDPKLIWTNSVKGLAFVAVSRAARHIPTVFYARGWYRRDQVPRLHRWLLKRESDLMLTLSEATATALEGWGVPRDRIRVVYITIDFEPVRRRAETGPISPLPGMQRPIKVVVPGVLLRTKGQHTAIKMVHLLKQRGCEVTLWIVGDVSMGSGSRYLEHLRELVHRHGLERNVFFLGWRGDLPAIIQAADYLVFPTHTEGLGRVVVEAMLLRRPVIACPVGGVTDLIIDGQTGVLAGVDDEAAFCGAVMDLVGDEQCRRRIVEAAFQRVHALLSPENQTNLLRRAFESIMAAHQRAP